MTREMTRVAVWMALAALVVAVCGHRPEPAPTLRTPNTMSPAGGQANPFDDETWTT